MHHVAAIGPIKWHGVQNKRSKLWLYSWFVFVLHDLPQLGGDSINQNPLCVHAWVCVGGVFNSIACCLWFCFVLLDKPVNTLRMEGEDLVRYLKGRHPPVEKDQVISKGTEIQQQIEAKRKSRTFWVSKLSNSSRESQGHPWSVQVIC